MKFAQSQIVISSSTNSACSFTTTLSLFPLLRTVVSKLGQQNKEHRVIYCFYYTLPTFNISGLHISMQKDKTQPVSLRATRHNAESEPSQGKHTRNTPNVEVGTLGSKSRKTGCSLKDSRTNIPNVTTAKKWLSKEELLIDGEEMTTSSLAQALMWLAAGDKNTVEQLVDGVRAIAMCLESCGCMAVADAAVVELKETAATWVEEAKKVTQKAVDIIVAEAKKKIEEGGSNSWADQMDGHERRIGADKTRTTSSYAQVTADSR